MFSGVALDLVLHSCVTELEPFAGQSKMSQFESGEAEYLSEVQTDLGGETERVLLLAVALHCRKRECSTVL